MNDITLTDEQNEILEKVLQSQERVIVIKGAAGGGKSTVALEIAKRLESGNYNSGLDFWENEDLPTKLITYTNALSEDLRKKSELASIDSRSVPSTHEGFIKLQSNLIDTYHSTYRNHVVQQVVYPGNNLKLKVVFSEDSDSLLPGFDLDFFEDEFSYICGNNFTKNDYLKAVRKGREQKLGRQQREKIYNFYEEYQKALNAKDRIMFSGIGQHYQDKHQGKKYFKNLIIDEVQDMHITTLKAFMNMVDDSGKIVLVGDVAQSIHKTGFSFKKIGVKLNKSNTFILTKNFRNPKYIYECANSLLEHQKLYADDELSDHASFKDTQILDKPQFYLFPNEIDAIESVCAHIRHIKNFSQKEDINPNIAIIYRKIEQITDLKNALESVGLYNFIEFITTKSCKGLEFDEVIVWGFNSDIYPIDDETARKELFVAITRAKKHVSVVGFAEPSELLFEFGVSTFQLVTSEHVSLINFRKAIDRHIFYYKNICAELENEKEHLETTFAINLESDDNKIQGFAIVNELEEKGQLEHKVENINKHISFINDKLKDMAYYNNLVNLTNKLNNINISGFYHMTSIDNLKSIIETGYFYSHNMLKKLGVGERSTLADHDILNSSSENGIVSFEKDGIVRESGSIHDFCRFYLNPKNAMSYRLFREKKPYIIIQISPLAFVGGRCRISNRNAAVRTNVKYITSENDFNNLDVEEIFAERWVNFGQRDQNRMQKMQAEFQVRDMLSTSFIEKVIVSNEDDYTKVKEVLSDYNIEVQKDCSKAYFWDAEFGLSNIYSGNVTVKTKNKTQSLDPWDDVPF